MANVYVKTDNETARQGYIPGGAPSNVKPYGYQASSSPSAGTSGRTKHTVSGTVAPIAKTTAVTNKTGGPVGGTGRTAEVKNMLSGASDNYYYGSSGSGGGGGGGYYSGGGTSATDSIVDMIKNLLNEQKQKADEYYKTLYEQQIAKNKQDWESNRNQINRNFMRGNRYLNSLYGDVSGAGLSNQARNSQNWQSNLASARQNYTNNDATALSQYNSGLANNASTLAQGWYNYVLPVYTNRQQNEDDYAYRRYLANL